jgi:hypothetical protein
MLWIATPMVLARLAAEGVTLTRRAPSGAPGAGAPSAGGGGGGAKKGSDDDDD